MNVTRIDDERDGRLADYRNVSDPDLLARRHLFVAEGRLVVRRLLSASRLTPRSVMATEPALEALTDLLATRPDLPVYLAPPRVMNGIIGFDIHRGCLALGERPSPGHWEDLVRTLRRVAVLERMANADNVGGVFRNAAAFGFDAVLMGPSCADPLYRKAIRTSMGAALTLPFADAEPWPDALYRLREDGWMTVAMAPAADAPPVRDVLARAAAARVAIVIGHEGDGLTAGARDACAHRARIPMTEGVDSLNAATAAAIAFYELTRT